MSSALRWGLGLLAALVLFTVIAPWFAVDPAMQFDLANGALLAPSSAHWLGTDQFSRDVLSRLATGGRNSLLIALVAITVATTLGSAVGLAAGSGDGILSSMWRRLIDVGLALPRIIVLLVLLAATGSLSTVQLALVIGITGWPGIARLVRGETLRLRHAPWVDAARALGETPRRILWREIFPATLPPVLVAATLGVADAILLEAGLSFIGLGLPVPAPSWGGMLYEAREVIGRAPWLLFFPAAALVAVTSATTLIGEALRRTLQPDSR